MQWRRTIGLSSGVAALVTCAIALAVTLPGRSASPAGSGAPAVFRDRLSGGAAGPEMVVVPEGRFLMGDLEGDGDIDEVPVREVEVPRFALSRREITFDEYDSFARAVGASLLDDSGFGRGERPVVNLTWGDAVAYAAWLSRETDRRYRLPSEAEWEYAARAGTRTRFWWGADPGRGRAVCSGCGTRWDGDSTAPVAQLEANPFGLFDVLGNVWEWTADCYSGTYAEVRADGRAHVYRDCGQKVIRGGSWVLPPREMRASNRWRFYPNAPGDEIGFRVARDLEPGEAP